MLLNRRTRVLTCLSMPCEHKLVILHRWENNMFWGVPTDPQFLMCFCNTETPRLCCAPPGQVLAMNVHRYMPVPGFSHPLIPTNQIWTAVEKKFAFVSKVHRNGLTGVHIWGLFPSIGWLMVHIWTFYQKYMFLRVHILSFYQQYMVRTVHIWIL